MSPNASKIDITRFSSEFAVLTEAARLIDRTDNPDEVLSPVLLMLSDLYKVENAAITIFNRDKNEIYVDVSIGLSDTEQMLGCYKPGEGITGNVFKSGKLKIVPRTTTEPKFLNKTKSKSPTDKNTDYSFICVPVKYSKQVMGTLSVTLPFDKTVNLESVAQCLGIITTLIAQPLVLRRRLKEVENSTRARAEENKEPEAASLLGNSRSIRNLKTSLYQHAKQDTLVLLVGENGTGKTFIAHTLHASGLRKASPLIRCSIASVDRGIVERKLFGQEKQKLKKSREEIHDDQPLVPQADNTSLLLEEVELLPPSVQKKLYTLLQTGELTINGDVRKSYARIILTASKQKLSDNPLIEPLQKLLQPVTIVIPPLRERKDDIMILADNFLQQASQKQHKPIKRFATPAIDLLFSYHWPGNLNEMQQVIEHAVRICEGGVIHAHMLPPSLQSAESTNTIETQGLHEIVAGVETDLIIDALKITHGNIKKAAHVLKISERILGLRINKYNVTPSKYR